MKVLILNKEDWQIPEHCPVNTVATYARTSDGAGACSNDMATGYGGGCTRSFPHRNNDGFGSVVGNGYGDGRGYGFPI
jgi:hypothetical protein